MKLKNILGSIISFREFKAIIFICKVTDTKKRSTVLNNPQTIFQLFKQHLMNHMETLLNKKLNIKIKYNII